MKPEESAFWFPAMSHGWGWGLPVRWQGWVVYALYFASFYAGIKYFRPRNDATGFMIAFALATLVLIAIVVCKGKRPLAWRWGGK